MVRTMQQNTDEAEYPDHDVGMVPYLEAANDRGEWYAPSHGEMMTGKTAQTVFQHRETSLLYWIKMANGDDEIAYRIDGTTEAIRSRFDYERGEVRHYFSKYGEATAWLRYWLVGAEIYDHDLTVVDVRPDTYHCVTSFLPPEWLDDFIRLLKQYSD